MLFLKQNQQLILVLSFRGVPGLQGPQGPIGVQGPKGDKGEQVAGFKGPISK
jgi:hypothetical protein